MNKKKILNLFYLYLLIQPIIDLATSLMTRYIAMPITLGIIIRGISIFICCLYIIFSSKSKYNKISKIYLLILAVYSIIYFVLKKSIFSNFSFIFTEVTYMFKYYYVLILILFFFNFFDEYKPNNRKVFKILQIDLFIYCLIIVLANITKTAYGTYEGGVGNTGWFYSGNEISVIITLLFPLLYLIVNKYNSFYCLFYIIPIIFGIEIIGTKTSMLGLLLPTAILLFYYLIRSRKGKRKQFLMTLIILAIIILSSNQLPVVENIKNSIYRYNDRIEKSDVIENVYSDGVLTTVLLSDRDYYQKNTYKIYSQAEVQDKLFGIGFVNRSKINDANIEKLIEMDFYDIFYHYGIIGFMIYFLPFIYITYEVVKSCIKLRFKLNFKQLLLGYISYVSLGIAFIVGHTLGSPAVTTYLSLIFVLLVYYLKYNNHIVELDDKKVTIMALHLGIGGIEKYIQSLSKMLIEDYEVEIISTYKAKNELKFDKKIKIRYLINDYPHINELKKSLKDHNLINIFKYGYLLFNILILKYYRNVEAIEEVNSKYIITTRIFHNKLVGYNKNREIVAIATEHNYHNNNPKYVNKLINSCNNIDYLVLVSEELKEYYQKLLKTTKCVYIPNVIDNISKYNKKTKYNFKLISVGRLVDEKGFEDLVDIIKIVKESLPKIKLDIYGDGPLMNSLNNKITTENLSETIKLCGYIANKNLLNIISEYDLYLMTSKTESFGIVLIEAMSRSVPCIAFDSANGAQQLLKDNQGILIKNRNIDLYAKEIIKLLNDFELLQEISLNGYKSVLKYDIKIIKKEWINLLKEEGFK